MNDARHTLKLLAKGWRIGKWALVTNLFLCVVVIGSICNREYVYGQHGPMEWGTRARGAPYFSHLSGQVGPLLVARSYSEAAGETRQHSVDSVFRDCEECPRMLVLPPGSFTMGSRDGEVGREEDESPRHLVNIDYRLAVGVYEVSFSEWGACVASGGCGGYVPDDMGWGRADRPVINVSWDNAQSYVSWLSKRTGASYRLLSESEWEYAARAGATTTYSWGNKLVDNRANCSGCGSRWDDETTAPVGSFAANAWGLHDMHGNVEEWVQDCWNNHYRRAPADGSAWEKGDSTLDCTMRVLRGGSWSSHPWFLRSAYRFSVKSPGPIIHFGFRVARTVGR